jgi:hypothetical protein
MTWTKWPNFYEETENVKRNEMNLRDLVNQKTPTKKSSGPDGITEFSSHSRKN